MSSVALYTKPVVDAFKTVFTSQPANNIARYSANAARALYVVGVVKGLWDAFQEVKGIRAANAFIEDSKETKSWVKAGAFSTMKAFVPVWNLTKTGGDLWQSFKDWKNKAPSSDEKEV